MADRNTITSNVLSMYVHRSFEVNRFFYSFFYFPAEPCVTLPTLEELNNNKP